MKRHAFHWVLVSAAAAGTSIASGCGSDAPATTPHLPRPAMLAPQTCQTCHQQHFADWQNSMHAKAADDPVFVAMNARGQRETKGQLGTFCVQCHAPMAVRDKMTTDGLNLATLPAYYRGVTCFFCHTIDAVGATHVNADVQLSGDLVMRGEIPDPQANSAHASVVSKFQSSDYAESAAMCGTCHDITAPPGGHIERTFSEWSQSAFSGPSGSTCTNSGCHMTPEPGNVAIATGGPTTRQYHAHGFPAVDVPLEPKPPNLQAVEDALNNGALQGALCVTPRNGIRVVLDTLNVGHHWPSGAAQDRRAWAEVIAYGPDGSVTYSSGVAADGTPVTSIADPDLWLLRDCMFDAQSRPVDNFWEAANVSGSSLPALLTFDAGDPNYYRSHVVRPFPSDPNNPILKQRPSRVTLRIRLQPVGLDVLNDLVASGDLDPGPDGGLIATMPTFDVSLQGPVGPGLATPGGLEWTSASNDTEFQDPDQGTANCAATPGFNPGSTVAANSAAKCSP